MSRYMAIDREVLADRYDLAPDTSEWILFVAVCIHALVFVLLFCAVFLILGLYAIVRP